jgi:hypothetical protein
MEVRLGAEAAVVGEPIENKPIEVENPSILVWCTPDM